MAVLDQQFAKQLIERFWMADRELYHAFEQVKQGLGPESEQELQRRILETMRAIQTGLVHPLYDLYPELRPQA